jgi:hypothetical protein
MKTKYSYLTLFSIIFLSYTLEAARAVCTCTGRKRPPNVEIELHENAKTVCEKECQKIGLQLVDAKKR